ncbi:antiactivator of flagellar biosynthesis FleN protein [Oxalobacter sp. OttesenSCG-928-P03]|nr:antiactivator of flagellar biosynthesis FleN protein [Oxalobacter sp. OttesenSCG-928-P03]
MDNFQFDQAEGLRRMLGEPRQRIYTFLSTLPHRNKNHLLFNLAASLSRSGSSVLLMDATCSREGVGGYQPQEHPSATLAQVARNEYEVDDAFYRVPQGFDVVCLAHHPREIESTGSFANWLDLSFESAVVEADVVMIDGLLDKDNEFPLMAMETSALILQVEDTEKSIKDAYMLIKRLAGRFGRMPFGVLVSGSGESRSQAIFRNMAQTAAHYLGIQLYSMGYVPKDDHMARAASLGRSVVDAFPMALSSFAFRRIAGSFSDIGPSQSNVYEMAGA